MVRRLNVDKLTGQAHGMTAVGRLAVSKPIPVNERKSCYVIMRL